MDLWRALAMVEGDECPNCHVNVLEFMEWEAREVKCTVCKTPYMRVLPYKYDPLVHNLKHTHKKE